MHIAFKGASQRSNWNQTWFHWFFIKFQCHGHASSLLLFSPLRSWNGWFACYPHGWEEKLVCSGRTKAGKRKLKVYFIKFDRCREKTGRMMSIRTTRSIGMKRALKMMNWRKIETTPQKEGSWVLDMAAGRRTGWWVWEAREVWGLQWRWKSWAGTGYNTAKRRMPRTMKMTSRRKMWGWWSWWRCENDEGQENESNP